MWFHSEVDPIRKFSPKQTYVCRILSLAILVEGISHSQFSTQGSLHTLSLFFKFTFLLSLWSENRLVMSNSLWPHGLYSPWNSPGQNTGVDSLSLLQGIFLTQELNPGLPHCRQILYQLSHKGSSGCLMMWPQIKKIVILKCRLHLKCRQQRRTISRPDC